MKGKLIHKLALFTPNKRGWEGGTDKKGFEKCGTPGNTNAWGTLPNSHLIKSGLMGVR